MAKDVLLLPDLLQVHDQPDQAFHTMPIPSDIHPEVVSPDMLDMRHHRLHLRGLQHNRQRVRVLAHRTVLEQKISRNLYQPDSLLVHQRYLQRHHGCRHSRLGTRCRMGTELANAPETRSHSRLRARDFRLRDLDHAHDYSRHRFQGTRRHVRSIPICPLDGNRGLDCCHLRLSADGEDATSTPLSSPLSRRLRQRQP